MFIREALIQRSKFYWIFVLLTVTLSYGFTLTHYSMGVDDESFSGYFHEGGLLSQGRWGSSLTKYFFDTYEFLPFWRDFIAIVLITTGITLWGHILKKNSNNFFNETGVAIFSCVAISCPFIANIFIFMMTTVEVGLILCLTAISINSYVKVSQKESKFKGLLVSIFSLVYAVSFGETAMVYFLIGIFIIGFLRVSFFEMDKERKKVLLFLLNGLILMFVVLLINSAIKYILQKIMEVPPSGYVSNMIFYDLSSPSSFVNSLVIFLKSLLKFFITRDHPGVKIAAFSSILIFIISTFLSIKRRDALLLGIGLGVVISAHALLFLTGNPSIPNRTMITNSVLVGFTMTLSYMILHKKFNKSLVSNTALVLMCILTFYQTKYINEVFYTDYLRFQLDKVKADVIANDILKETDGKNKKVVFIGQPDNYNLKIGEVEGYSIFQWDRFGGNYDELRNNHRILSFINLQGYFIQGINDVDLLEVLHESADMPIYPSIGYVKDIGQYLIVKIGYTPQILELNDNQLNKIKQGEKNVKYDINQFSYDSKNISIAGWGFLDDKKKSNDAIFVALFNKERTYYLSTKKTSRPDVLSAFPNLEKDDDLGFQLFFSANIIKSGEYDVALIFDNGVEKQKIYLGRNVKVQ